jgi:HAD superfamily hydrolase (TIGR01509 family)
MRILLVCKQECSITLYLGISTENKMTSQPQPIFLGFKGDGPVDIINLVKENNIKMVYWDLGGTLVDIPGTMRERIVSKINKDCAANINVDLYDWAIKDEWKQRETPKAQQRIKFVKSKEAELEYWIEFFTCVLKKLRLRYKNPQLITWLAKIQASPNSFEIYPYVQETLAKLGDLGIRIGIISNAFPSARKILKHTKLIQKFGNEHIILSCEYNSIKPERAIYQKAIKKAGVNPSEILFIDDRESFVEGAVETGIEAVIIATAASHNADREHRIGTKIHIIKLLTAIIGSWFFL